MPAGLPGGNIDKEGAMKRVKWALILAVVCAMIAAPALVLAADAPAEAPKAEAAKAEAPKAEAPKAEAPKAEAPKAEAPKAEAPAAAPAAAPAK